MKNHQLLPFVRNRYFTGKSLTAGDFEIEQLYGNNKRRFVNTLMYGESVVCGLSTFALDDHSILIESGLAVDGMGREIVIPETTVRKISSISGYNDISTSKVSLGIKYKEETMSPVYTTQDEKSEKEIEKNHVIESYDLFLVDSELTKFKRTDKLYCTQTMYEDKHYQVEIEIPESICTDKEVKLIVRYIKKSNEEVEFGYETNLQLAAFITEEGQHELLVNNKVNLKSCGEIEEFTYWLQIDSYELCETNIINKKNSSYVHFKETKKLVDEQITMKVHINDRMPEEVMSETLGSVNLEARLNVPLRDIVVIATIQLEELEDKLIIKNIDKTDVKYILNSVDYLKSQRYINHFRNKQISKDDVQILGVESDRNNNGTIHSQRSIMSGVVEIPLEIGMKKGDIFISEEIIHGLGKGNVYVTVGCELVEFDERMGKDLNNTIYGNMDLFKKMDKQSLKVDTAVKVFKDKGSFQIAMKLMEEQTTVVILLRWVAMKMSSIEEADVIEDYNVMSIRPNTPSVVLAPGESYYYEVKFNNMKPCRVSYEVDNYCGIVGTDGIYTAPKKAGVYEIKIYCTDKPRVSTYAYAIVKG